MGLCVTMTGTLWMPLLSVPNLDSLTTVKNTEFTEFSALVYSCQLFEQVQ